MKTLFTSLIDLWWKSISWIAVELLDRIPDKYWLEDAKKLDELFPQHQSDATPSKKSSN